MRNEIRLTEQTIAARLERLPNSRWHITVTVILGVAIFFDSFDSLAIAYVLRGRGGGRSGVSAAQGTIGVDWHPGAQPRP